MTEPDKPDVNALGIQALREKEQDLLMRIAEVRAEFEGAQAAATRAQGAVDSWALILKGMDDQLLSVQVLITDGEEAAYARKAANESDQPTNIPEPDHEVPLTPLDPAEGEE